jgi:hypothetical protein
MVSCKEVTRLISESMDRQMPFGQRMAMRMHLFMCKFCSRYRDQLLLLRNAMRYYLEKIEPSEPLLSTSLSLEAREKIKHTLATISDQ